MSEYVNVRLMGTPKAVEKVTKQFEELGINVSRPYANRAGSDVRVYITLNESHLKLIKGGEDP